MGAKQTGFGILPQTAILAEAKALMDRRKYCSDVFVTEDGTREGKATGWITNVIVQEQAQLSIVAMLPSTEHNL